MIVKNWENDEKNPVIMWGIKIELYETSQNKIYEKPNIKCASVTISK